MAKQLTKTYQEALKMLSDCKITAEPIVQNNGTDVAFLLEDPMGQRFFLHIQSEAMVGMNGNLLSVKSQQRIVAFEPEAGDMFRDIKF